MSAQPETHFARTPEGSVAYQVLGEGPIDLVFVSDWRSNIEVMWEEPRIERFFRRLATFSRTIVFDKRGSGISDPVPQGALPTVEAWMDDITAVMDDVDSARAAIFGHSTGGFLAMPFAAAFPNRTSHLVLFDAMAATVRSDGYGPGLPPAIVERARNLFVSAWGVDAIGRLEVSAPSLAADPAFCNWWARYERLSQSPAEFERLFDWGMSLDVRDVLPAIRIPTLVLQRPGDQYTRAEAGKWIAAHIPHARYVELDGDDHLYFAGDQDSVLDEVETFLTGTRGAHEIDRVLATILFTDIVASTERTSEVGDRRWKETLDLHDRLVRSQIESFRGRVIKTTGDGVLATFDGPARAIRCAAAISATVERLGIEIRTGLHTGEVELRDDDIGGIAVALAARVMAEAGAREVLVSSTVKDLVVGSGIEFDDRGSRTLKGVPGEWRLYAVRS